MPHFTLQASNVSSPLNWTWTLRDEGDMFVADQVVSLNAADWQYQAFLDLHGYLNVHAAPDNRRASQHHIIEQVGRWIGEYALGQNIGGKLAEAARTEPVIVHVVVDRETTTDNEDHILFRPLELAHINDKPLTLQEISLVFGDRSASDKDGRAAYDQPLRMLAVFSLPLNVSALNLRHERYELRRMIRRIVADRSLDFELRVLQYGVTREALKKLLSDGPGWDIVHFFRTWTGGEADSGN